MADRSGAELTVSLAGALRAEGVAVPVGSVIVFARAAALVGLFDREALYWAGRATLLTSPEEVPSYEAVFNRFFVGAAGAPVALGPRTVVTSPRQEPQGAKEEGSPRPGPSVRGRYSARELLRQEDFARYSEGEWQEAARLIAALRSRPESRPSRRLRPASSPGRLDMARTVRAALESDGEPLRRAYSSLGSKARRIVFVVDISGSMEPYARAFLRLAHAVTSSRPAGSVEAFALGTRLTRLTRQLARRDPDAALAGAARLVEDWYGGTRLGEGLAQFNSCWGSRGIARGSVVVLLSDGWDRGEPDRLGEEMGRLKRLAHRVVWVNPLRASPGYAPLAAGMAAALPHVDDFVDGHSLGSLEDLVALLSAPSR